MAWLDDVFSGWGTTVLIGVGVALAAPVLLPAAGALVRPVAKALLKGGLLVVDSLQELLAEGQAQLRDVVAEARAETAAGTPETTTAGGPGATTEES